MAEVVVRPRPERHRTGERASLTGIYLVIHEEHRLPVEVTMLRGLEFPRCAGCEVAVEFEFLRATQERLPAGTMRLNELPVVDGDD